MAKIKTPKYDANDVFFTADLHLGHYAVAGHRGYEDKLKMNEDIIENWNNAVNRNSVVFVLGDISFCNSLDTVQLLLQLNGTMHLIRGNHDKSLSNDVLGLFQSDNQQLEIDVLHPEGKQRVYMSHYAHRVWNRHHFGAFHLFGHSHGSLKGSGKSMDVGLDTNNLTPWTFEAIKAKLDPISIQGVDHHKEQAPVA